MKENTLAPAEVFPVGEFLREELDEHVHALAVQAGVDDLRPARVVDVALRAGSSPRLTVEGDSGRASFGTRFIVDATGRAAWLARRLGHLHPMPEHPIRSVWARYRNLRDFDGDWLATSDTSRGPGRSGPGSVP